MDKRKVLIIGAGFNAKQISAQIGYMDHLEMIAVHKPMTSGKSEGFTKNFTEFQIEKINDIAKKTGVSFENLIEAIEKIDNHTRHTYSGTFESIDGLKESLKELAERCQVEFNKPTYEEPKSKYINKPKFNFKRR